MSRLALSTYMGNAKSDCFAYTRKGSGETCNALNALYCKTGKCRFYKAEKGEKK